MKYNKPPLTIEQQVDHLAARGLAIPDKARAAHYLATSIITVYAPTGPRSNAIPGNISLKTGQTSSTFSTFTCSTRPETYFQAAFRVQSPWTIRNPDSTTPNREQIIKEECYVFDFAPDRALRQIADYSCRLNINEANPEKKVEEFISFLPVLAYDGSSMKQIDAAGVLDMAMSGTTATLLARRWESALLVNVDNDTLRRLMENQKAMDALMSIEGFRNLNQDIETIINKSEAVKKVRKEANDEDLSPKEKKKLTEEEKEYKSKRKEIQE